MRIAVIEIGHWHADQYAQGVRGLGEDLVAVSDHNPETARGKAEALGCRAYTDHVELIDREQPDFVFAHGVHAEMTQIAADLVERGMAFAMEKPMGVDWRQLLQVTDAAEARGLFAGVDLVMRGYKLPRELLRLRDAHQLGRVVSYYHRLFAGGPERYRNWNVPWMLDRARAGGGPLFNFGPHVIDLFLLLSGQEVQSVFCRSSHALHGLDVEDYASVILSSASGAVGTIEVGYVCPDALYDRFFSVCTDRLFVSSTEFDRATIAFRDGRRIDLDSDDCAPALDYVSETLRRFRSGEPPVASLRDMCRILRVINAAVDSAERGQPVALSE